MTDKLSPAKLTFAKRAFRAIRLTDIPTGTATIVREQENWLTEAAHAVPSNREFHVYVIGYASKLGYSHTSHESSDQLNVQLSYRRANAVTQIMERSNPRVTTHNDLFEAKGNSEYAASDQDNSAAWRAVEVHIFLDEPPPPPHEIKPLPPARPPGSTNWRMRVFRDSGASLLVVEGDAVVFQIVDVDKGQCGMYYYLGVGIAIAVAKIPTSPGSIASAGDFQDYKTSRPVYLEDYEGAADLSISPGLAVGSLSLGGTLYFSPQAHKLLALPGTHKTVVNDSAPIPLTTGNGFSVGLGSSSSGKLSKPVIFGPGECCKAPGGKCTKFT
jgi:hypothetical protein